MAAFILVQRAYKSVMGQEKVIEQQQDNIRFLNEANSLIDIGQATGVAMKEEYDKLSASQSILQELRSRLGGAVAAWRATEPGVGGQPWTETSTAPASYPELDGGSSGGRMHGVEQNISSSYDLRDPAFGNAAHWERQWNERLPTPRADPVNLVIDPTQVILDREAFAASRERARNKSLIDPAQLIFTRGAPEAAQEEEEEEESILDDTWWMSEDRSLPTRQAPTDDIHGIYPEPNLPFRYAKIVGTGLECQDFVPGFWRKQLEGRGDIWAPKPVPSLSESYKRQWDRVEECLSPKSQLPQWARVPTTSFAEAVRRERKREEATPYSPSDAWSKKPRLRYYM
jgi:hypothetical protein